MASTGVGILFGTTSDASLRSQMMAAISPFWDGNETWLVVIGASRPGRTWRGSPPAPQGWHRAPARIPGRAAHRHGRSKRIYAARNDLRNLIVRIIRMTSSLIALGRQ